MAVGLGSAESGTDVVKPIADRRSYEHLELDNGVRFLLVSDPDAVFAAACANVQAGYFDDPPTVPGFAHWLEHAVHLGSGRYPADTDYKYFLSQHGGTSNASTGMVHTSYHLTVSAPQLPGALDRLGRFFTDPLLLPDSILKEAENVHAEFSRNTNSDARKLLQLRRQAAGPPLAKFSTGNRTTLLDGPQAAGLDVPAQLAGFWRATYLGPALCGCVVGPQPLDQLRGWVAGAFGEVRRTPGAPIHGDGGEDRGGGGAVGGADVRGGAGQQEVQAHGKQQEQQEPGAEFGVEDRELAAPALPRLPVCRYDYGGMFAGGSGAGGRLFRVASQRELRQMEVVWGLPYGMLPYMRSKPWRWAGHVLGHEGPGSLAALLREAGLAQALTTGPFDEVRLGRGFMLWGVTLTLSEAGLRRAEDVLRLVFGAVQAMCALPEDQRRTTWDELAATSAVRWHYADRTTPLELAKEAANRLHYFRPQELLSGPSLLYEYDSAALDRFLSYLQPPTATVYLADSSFAGTTTHVEQWYGARYSEERLPAATYDDIPYTASANTAPSTAPPATTLSALPAPATALAAAPLGPDSPLEAFAARLSLPFPPNWALPLLDLTLLPPQQEGGPEQQQQQQGQGEEHEATETQRDESVTGSAEVQSSGAHPGSAGPGAGASGQAADQPPVQAQPQGVVPVLLQEGRGVRLWHARDTSFGVPKVHVFAHVITRRVYDNPAAWVTARLACRTLDELLAPRVYDAQLCGCGYSLGCSETGLQLAVAGFPGVVRRLAEVVVGAMAEVTLEEVQGRYGLVHGKLLQGLRMWRQNNPAQHAEYGAEHVLQAPHWHVEDSIAVLEAVPGYGSGGAATAGGGGGGRDDAEAGGAAAGGVEDGAGVGAGPEAVLRLLRTLGQGADLEVLCYGNIAREQAQDLCSMLQSHLRPTGLAAAGQAAGEGEAAGAGGDGTASGQAGAQGATGAAAWADAGGAWPATRILKLEPWPLGPGDGGGTCSRGKGGVGQEAVEDEASGAVPEPEVTGYLAMPDTEGVEGFGSEKGEGAEGGAGGGPVLVRYVPPNPNSSNSNSAIYYLAQVGEDLPCDPRPAVLLALLAAVASKPAFHALRTQQRLGYSVSLAKQRLGGVVGLSLRVQSPDRDPGVLRERVAEWVEGFGQELRALSPERLASFKSSLAQRLTEPPRSLAEAARRAWQPVRYRAYDFDKRRRRAEALEGVTLEDLVSFYERHVRPSAPTARVLCCEVWGGRAGAAAAAGTEAGAGAGVGAGTGGSGAPRRRRAARAVGGSAGGDAGGQQAAPAVAEEAAGEGQGAVGEEAGQEGGQALLLPWRTVVPEQLPALHAALPHYCHAATLGVLRGVKGHRALGA